jgi:hypothetical protein
MKSKKQLGLLVCNDCKKEAQEKEKVRLKNLYKNRKLMIRELRANSSTS